MGQRGEPWIPAALPQRSAVRKQDDCFSPSARFHCDKHLTALQMQNTNCDHWRSDQESSWGVVRNRHSPQTDITLSDCSVTRPAGQFTTQHTWDSESKCVLTSHHQQTKGTKPFQTSSVLVFIRNLVFYLIRHGNWTINWEGTCNFWLDSIQIMNTNAQQITVQQHI